MDCRILKTRPLDHKLSNLFSEKFAMAIYTIIRYVVCKLISSPSHTLLNIKPYVIHGWNSTKSKFLNVSYRLIRLRNFSLPKYMLCHHEMFLKILKLRGFNINAKYVLPLFVKKKLNTVNTNFCTTIIYSHAHHN